MRNLLINAARLAGSIHKDVLRRGPVEGKSKSSDPNSRDLVTIADPESEKALRTFFSKHLPTYNIFGEEFGATYNGNGKVLVIDPLDCTHSYAQGLPVFGPIIAVYEHGECVAGIEYNVLKNIIHVATLDTGFEQIGSKEEGLEKNVIDVESKIPGVPDFAVQVRERVRQKFPKNPVIIQKQDILCRSRVCTGYWAAYFHAGEALHDFSPIPLFGRLTDTLVQDHTGKPYDRMDPVAELQKYQRTKATEDRKYVYSHPLLVVKKEYAEGMLEILSHFKEGLDKRQNPN